LNWEFDNDLGFEIPGVEISLNHLRVQGLDSFTLFDIWQPIAPQTIQNTMRWDDLVLELGINVKNTTTAVEQQVKVSFSIGDIETTLPLFIALDQDKLGDLELGSFLHTEDILPCLVSALHSVEVTQMLVSIGRLDDPIIEGLMSDTQEIVSSFTQELFGTYRAQILDVFPTIFDSTVRKLLNGFLSSYIDNAKCKVHAWSEAALETSDSSFVDFRDLFLSAAVSRTYGGAGNSQYGDLFRTALGIVQGLVLKVDSIDHMSAMNDVLIGPLTRSQSSQTGSLVFPGSLFDQGTRVRVGGLDAQIQLRASDARIDNLDTVSSPLFILDPVRNEQFELNNTATFGKGERPLHFAVRFLISLMDDGKYFMTADLKPC
jgi:hypothetical protein